jgi:SHOCT-like protein
MTDPRREILNQVASGTITAEEGAARLEALEPEPAAAEATPTPALPASTGIRQVTVNSRFGNTEIVGDPSVATAVADGSHRARQEGDSMVFDQSLLSGETTFEFNRSRFSIPGFNSRDKLIVRMNPALALRMRVQAGNVAIRGVKGPITTDVQAGNCIVDGFAGPVNLMVSAGNLEASGRLDGGSSAIRCQMGEVKVNLDRTSNVRITAHTTMGKVDVEGVRDQVVGTGAGTLEITCTMGDVKVSVG